MNPLVDHLGKSLNRRQALRNLGLAAAGATALSALPKSVFGAGATADAQQDQDPAIFNFALNLEYLEAEFYTYAVFGTGIESQGVQTGGAGTPGPVTIKDNPKVPFKTPEIEQYAKEIGHDERNHVMFFREALQSAGAQPVARPHINLKESFDTLAKAAGIADTFDPFANEFNFLLGAFIFEDVGVTLFAGASPLITNKAFLLDAASVLAVEAYHAGNIRVNLFNAGSEAHDAAQKISDLRKKLSGKDDDRGVVGPKAGHANIVPTDSNGRAFTRTTRQGLNIVYGARGASKGLFFPEGLNGSIK